MEMHELLPEEWIRIQKRNSLLMVAAGTNSWIFVYGPYALQATSL